MAAPWPLEYRSRLVDQIREFAETTDNLDEKVKLWNTVREFVALHRSFRDAEWALPEADVLLFENLLGPLAPEFPKQYIWLFSSEYPQLTRPKVADHQEQDREAETERQRVIQSIFEERGLPGILALATSVGHPGPSIVGRTLAQVIDGPGYHNEVMEMTLGAEDEATRNLGIGFVYRLWHRFGNSWVSNIVLSADFRNWNATKMSDFCLALPSDRSTWEIVETLSREAQATYWKRAYVFVTPATDSSDAHYAIRKIIEARRAYDALHFVGSYPAIFATDLLIEVLNTVFDALSGAREPVRDSMLSHYIQRILERLQGANDVSEEVLSVVEWKLLPALQFDYAPAALNRRLQRDPTFFADIVRCIFQGEEKSEESEPQPVNELESRRANVAWKLLSHWRLPPGVRDDHSLDGVALSDWVRRARAACTPNETSEKSETSKSERFWHGSPLGKTRSGPRARLGVSLRKLIARLWKKLGTGSKEPLFRTWVCDRKTSTFSARIFPSFFTRIRRKYLQPIQVQGFCLFSCCAGILTQYGSFASIHAVSFGCRLRRMKSSLKSATMTAVVVASTPIHCATFPHWITFPAYWATSPTCISFSRPSALAF